MEVDISVPDPAHDDVDLPRMQAGGSPQHLLLTLLGDYWYGQHTPMPSAALVDLLAEFKVTEVGARAALSRLARRGLLELAKEGRRTYYRLSPRAAAVLSEGIQHILSFGASDSPWQGRWTVAAFSIPEEQRDLRHTLRTRLRWLGLAPLYDGTWVSPHDRSAEVGGVLTELGVVTGTVFTAVLGPGSPPGGDPMTAWDLDALRHLYEEIIERYTPLQQRCRQGLISTAEALVSRTGLMDAWRNFPNLDPELPAELLPDRWPRARARRLFIELYDGMASLAETRVKQIVAAYEPDLADLVRSHPSTFTG
jgi:phenylacetic acid degradation operon negative regulatory protein